MTQYWGGGGTRHFFPLSLYNFKNIGGHVPLPPPPTPQSLLQMAVYAREISGGDGNVEYSVSKRLTERCGNTLFEKLWSIKI